MIERSKEWWMEKARAEGDATVGAGVPDQPDAEEMAREWLGKYERDEVILHVEPLAALLREYGRAERDRVTSLEGALREVLKDEWRVSVDWGVREEREAIFARAEALLSPTRPTQEEK